MTFKHFVLIVFILIPWLLSAQNTSGAITFVETTKLEIELDHMDEEMAKMIPKSQSATMELFFNQKESVYSNKKGAESGDIDVSSTEGDNEFRFQMKRPENTLYCDLEKGTSLNKTEFFGRMFLINGPVTERRWKVTGEKRKIGEFVCQKAELIDTAEVVVAWFTPQIPVSSGPAGFGQLPGMILEMDIDDGQRTIMVTELSIRPVTKDELSKPTKGKKVSKEEFEKIREEKLKELGVETGGNGRGNRVIIHTVEERN